MALAIAATSMRQILVERARAKQAEKRGGDRDRITLDEATFGSGPDDVALDLLAIDEALTRMEESDERHWEAELRRLRGGLMLMAGEEARAEVSLQQAIATARQAAEAI